MEEFEVAALDKSDIETDFDSMNFVSPEEYRAAIPAMNAKSAIIIDNVRANFTDADNSSPADAAGGWQTATSVGTQRTVPAINSNYSKFGVLKPTFSPEERGTSDGVDNLSEEDNAAIENLVNEKIKEIVLADAKGRGDYFGHLAGDLSDLTVAFHGVKVYPNGVPEDKVVNGAMTNTEDFTVVMKYGFYGINKGGEVENRKALGSFAIGKDENGQWKINEHTSSPIENVPDFKQDLHDTLAPLAPQGVFEVADADVTERLEHGM